MEYSTDRSDHGAGRHSALEVLAVSLRLGLTSFGGPIAHLGYFERTYVRERQWLSTHEFGELLALCQIIPGPASSQLGFLIGLKRAGYRGALAAWLGFTLPSAMLLFAGASVAARGRGAVAEAVLHGLKLVAVAVVAQALWSMGRRLCTERVTIGIGIASAGGALLWAGTRAQLGCLGLGALAGAVLCRGRPPPSAMPHAGVSRPAAWAAFIIFVVLLLGLPAVAQRFPHGAIALSETFYRAGALVFGGGHVVLPLLQGALVPAGWLSDDSFLAGYGLAQAVPGPLFTVAAYLGAANDFVRPPIWASLIALISIFLPGLLLALAAVAAWTGLASHPRMRGALVGVNAAVVGLLGAALYDPLWTSSIRTLADGLIAALGVVLLGRWRVPPILIVLLCIAGSIAELAWR